MKPEKKINPPVISYFYRYCVCYVQSWKIILTYEDWGYYLWGRHPRDIEPLKIEQADEMTARRVLRIAQSLQSKKEKNEKK